MSPCSLEIDYGQSRWVHTTPVFGRSQTSPRFGCGFLHEDAEIRECEPTPRVVSVVGQHRNQTSVARETARILHPDIDGIVLIFQVGKFRARNHTRLQGPALDKRYRRLL